MQALKPTVNLWLFDAEGRLFLQFRDGTEGICNPLMWNFFGGGVDPGEDFLAAAVRELFEETGLRARPEDLDVLFEGEILGKEFTKAVRLKRTVRWEDLALGEGAGAGRFTESELVRMMETGKVTPVTKEILARGFKTPDSKA